MIRPLNSRVILRPDPPPEKSGSIILPNQRPDTTDRGTVIAAGPESDLKPGDKLLFSKTYALPFEHEGETLLMVAEEGQLMVLS